ncbi:MAG: class II aldolase/adducin family protein [bacterium]
MAINPSPTIDWNKTVRPYLSAIAHTASRLSAAGWAEKNAGNFSIRSGDLLVTKITGSPMQQIAVNPPPYLCLVQAGKKALRYRVFPSSVKPTEELITHILGQRVLSKFRPHEIVLLHTHPLDIIRLTPHFPQPRTLFQNLVALDDSIKDTVTVLPFLKPGSFNLARASGRALNKSPLVIWINHGAIASGKTLFASFRKIRWLNRLARKISPRR